MATLKVKDVAIELDDRDHALINSHINDLKESVAQLTTQLQTVKDDDGKQVAQLTTQVTTLDTAVKAKDAEIVTLKKQLDDAKITPEKLRDAARAYQTVCDQAKRLLPALVADGKDEIAIRREVVNAKLGDAAKAWDDGQVKVSFETLAAALPAQQQDSAPPTDGGGFRDLAAILQTTPQTGNMSAIDKAINDRDKRMEDAWKPK
jgi:hypothetical protein